MLVNLEVLWNQFWVLVEAIPGFVDVSPREGSRKFAVQDIL